MDDAVDTIRDARPFDEAADELKRLLGVLLEPELTAEIGRLVSDEFVKFVKIEVQPSPTSGVLARPMRMLMEPSDLFLSLIAAARTHDANEVRRAVDEVRSLLGVATAG